MKTVSENAYAALMILKERAIWLTTSDMGEALGFSHRTAKDWARELHSTEAVERRRYTRGFSYGYEYKYLCSTHVTPRDYSESRARALARARASSTRSSRAKANPRVAAYLAAGEKHCSGCREVKPLDLFQKNPTGSYGSLCRPCRSDKWRRWYERNSDERRKKAAREREFYERNKDLVNSKRRKQRSDLTDGYVASLLFPRGQLSRLDTPIPQSLIEAKRANVLIKRMLKEKKEAL